MEVTLICVGGKHAGQQVPVPGPEFFIGRAEDCHLRPGSALVSLHHAVILVEEGSVAIRDFASKNGTYVNGERIKAERRLKTGEHLNIGPLEFEVHLSAQWAGRRGRVSAVSRKPLPGLWRPVGILLTMSWTSATGLARDKIPSAKLRRQRPSRSVQFRLPSPA